MGTLQGDSRSFARMAQECTKTKSPFLVFALLFLSATLFYPCRLVFSAPLPMWQNEAFHSLPFFNPAGRENLMGKIQFSMSQKYADKTGMVPKDMGIILN